LGVLLEDLTWLEAEAILTRDAIGVIPLGAAAKEHGPHLRLNNDWVIAEYLKGRVLQAAPVVVAPTVAYHYYPAFVEYPGSTTLAHDTARDSIADICRSLSQFGPRRFYVLNTGVSTRGPLQAAAERLAAEGILLRYSDLRRASADARSTVEQQEGGTHADEIETSIMLHIAPERVDMRKAVRDYHPGSGRLTRVASGEGVFSASGTFGDATLATPDKGRVIVEALVAGILRDIEVLRAAPLT
jgi:creatinine amidohydrolase